MSYCNCTECLARAACYGHPMHQAGTAPGYPPVPVDVEPEVTEKVDTAAIVEARYAPLRTAVERHYAFRHVQQLPGWGEDE